MNTTAKTNAGKSNSSAPELEDLELMKVSRLDRRKSEFRHRLGEGPLFKMRGIVSVRPGETIDAAANIMAEKGLDVLPVFDQDGANIGAITAESIENAQRTGSLDLKHITCGKVIEAPLKTAGREYVEEEMSPNECVIQVDTRGRFQKIVFGRNYSGVTAGSYESNESVDKDTPVTEAIRIMEQEEIPALPIIENAKIIGSISLSKAKAVTEYASEPYDKEKTRCWTMMEAPLRTVRETDTYDRIATQVGIHGTVLVEDAEGITGMVVGRVDRTKAERRMSGRMTYLPKNRYRKGGGIKKTKVAEGRPGIAGIAVGMQRNTEVHPLDAGDIITLERWKRQLDSLRLETIQEDGRTSLEPLTNRNKILLTLIMSEQGKEELLNYSFDEGLHKDIFETTSKYLREINPELANAFSQNRSIYIGSGSSLQERLRNASLESFSERFDEEETPPRYRPVNEIKRGAPYKMSAAAIKPILKMLEVEWRDRDGRPFSERLNERNQLLVKLILTETGRERLLESDAYDKDARERIIGIARGYIRKHNPAMLRRFNTNIQIYLGDGDTLSERVQKATSTDDLHREGKDAKKKLAREKAEQVATDAFQLAFKQREKDMETERENRVKALDIIRQNQKSIGQGHKPTINLSKSWGHLRQKELDDAVIDIQSRVPGMGRMQVMHLLDEWGYSY
ncbi:MAG: CBS domain-containing protein [Candidatus Altiarchaeota archaeon]